MGMLPYASSFSRRPFSADRGAAGEAISVLIKAVALIGAISAYVSDGRRGRLADGDLIFPFFPFSCFSFCFSSFRLQNSPDGPCPSVEGKLSCFR